jgi:hypothetical protein
LNLNVQFGDGIRTSMNNAEAEYAKQLNQAWFPCQVVRCRNLDALEWGSMESVSSCLFGSLIAMGGVAPHRTFGTRDWRLYGVLL